MQIVFLTKVIFAWLLATDGAAAVHERVGELIEAQRYTEASRLCRAALSVVDLLHPHESLETALLLRDLAKVQRLEGYHAKAEDSQRRSLRIIERELGPTDASLAIGLDGLAEIQFARGRFTEARQTLERARTIAESTLPGSPHLATILNDLGAVYQTERRYADAESALERALAIRQTALGPHHPHVAVTVQNLVSVYKAESKCRQASTLERAWRSRN